MTESTVIDADFQVVAPATPAPPAGGPSTLTRASHQWATRPADQRFLSLDEMADFKQGVRDRSRGLVVSTRKVEALPIDGDHRGLAVVIDNDRDNPVLPTNWAFGQLAQRADAPASYLAKLRPDLAADCVNYGLRRQGVDEVGLLSVANLDPKLPSELAAATGPNYGRIWDADILRQLRENFGDGRTGNFRVPGEFGRDVPITRDNTTLYASDRDMFVFLADEKHRIEVPNRRDGKPGSLARGFFIQNSEVGKATLYIAGFYFDYVCMNRMVWGVEGFQEVSIRHTSGAPDRFLEEVTPALEAYSTAGTTTITRAIEDARAKRIDEVEDFLNARFTRSQTKAIVLAHEVEENRPIESIWDAAVGITAYAKGVKYQDQRVDLERSAGKVLKLAA